jgi:stage II sporulation protein D
MSSPHPTRRHFTRSFAAALTLPRLSALAQLAPQPTLRFSVFSLFQPQRLTIHSTEPLLLRLDQQPPQPIPANMLLQLQTLPNDRLQLAYTPTQTSVATHAFTLSSLAGTAAPFTLAVPPPALHGTIQRSYHGTLRVQNLRRVLTALASILHAESPPGPAATYLQVQAIVSRSFLRSAATGHHGFDFCDTTHCQFLREPPPLTSPIYAAIRDTRSLRLTFNAAPFPAMYSRSCGGRTRTLAELGLPISTYPYYAVDCPFCLHYPERWERPFTSTPDTERDRLARNRIYGWSTLPSNSFTPSENQSGPILEGRGIGHGIGLCQRGAAALAANLIPSLQNPTAPQILALYYPNTALSA